MVTITMYWRIDYSTDAILFPISAMYVVTVICYQLPIPCTGKYKELIARSSYRYVVPCNFRKLLPLFVKGLAHIEVTNSTLQLPIV